MTTMNDWPCCTRSTPSSFIMSRCWNNNRRSRTEVADADKRLAKIDEFAPNEPKPYSFLLLEGLKDQLAEQQHEEIGC